MFLLIPPIFILLYLALSSACDLILYFNQNPTLKAIAKKVKEIKAIQGLPIKAKSNIYKIAKGVSTNRYNVLAVKKVLIVL